MSFKYNDGGRAEAGYKGTAGDCACRAIAIATGMSYQDAYDLINKTALTERHGKRKRGVSNARTGVYKQTLRKIMLELGWKWTPTMFVGSGCNVHLKAEELPKGTLVVAVSKHYVAVIDGAVNDTHDPTRQGKRCVYGYYQKQ